MLNEEKKVKRRELTIAESLALGNLAGFTEVLIDQPLVTTKIRIQCKLPFTLKPSILYLGFIPNLLSMAPITSLQMASDTAFKQFLLRYCDELSVYLNALSAISAGIVVALLSCPQELIMTHQQESTKKPSGVIKNNQSVSFVSIAKNLWQEKGMRSFYAGYGATAGRDGIFSAGYLVFTPLVHYFLEKHHLLPSHFFSSGDLFSRVPLLGKHVKKQKGLCNELTDAISAGIIAGAASSFLSQPFDTIKTRQQQPSPTSISFRNVMRCLYQSDGARSFFKGGFSRGLRITSAITIISAVNQLGREYIIQENTTTRRIK